jgi:hypothetical protein
MTLIRPASPYSIDIVPGATDCFMVKAALGVPITGSFEVIHPDADYIFVEVTGPKGDLHYEKKPKPKEGEEEDSSEGFFSFDAEVAGDYTMCISNGKESDNDGVPRLIAFNFRAAAEGETDYQFVGLQSELVDLKEGLDLLRDHQSYMNQREDVHKDTLESINVKVLTWTILETIILIAMALWQTLYIRSFFEIKRRM